jgi:hypothetical protein
MDSGEQGVYLLGRVVHPERGSGGCRDTESLHERLCAMVSSTNGDAFLVEDRADVMWMNPIEDEGQHSCLFLGGAYQAGAGY